VQLLTVITTSIWSDALEISQGGRLRWKIENEGFNIQKNHGYKLKHKYSRSSYLAAKNYYQCLQIAHLINQLAGLSSNCRKVLQGKTTFMSLWKHMIAFLTCGVISCKELSDLLKFKTRISLE